MVKIKKNRIISQLIATVVIAFLFDLVLTTMNNHDSFVVFMGFVLLIVIMSVYFNFTIWLWDNDKKPPINGEAV